MMVPPVARAQINLLELIPSFMPISFVRAPTREGCMFLLFCLGLFTLIGGL